MCDRRLRDLIFGLLNFFSVGIKNRPQIQSKLRLEDCAAQIHLLAENNFVFVNFARHVGLLRALAGKHEHDGRVFMLGNTGENPFRVARFKSVHGVVCVAANQHPPMREVVSSDLKRVRDIGEIKFRTLFQLLREICRRLIERRFRFGREQKQLRRARSRRSFQCRGFFENDVRVCAADAERTHAGPARRPAVFPFRKLCADKERAVREINFRIRRFKMQARRNFFMVQRQRGFDQAGDARRRVEMADAAFHRADGAEMFFVRSGAKRLRQPLDFNRIAELRAGAVRLDKADGFGREPGHRLRGGDDFGLAFNVVVERKTFDDGVNCVAIFERVCEPFQHDDADAFARDRAGGLRIKRAAMSVRRRDAAFLKNITALLGKHD